MIQLREQWPWILNAFLPPEFGEVYRSKHSDKSGPAFINQAASDLIFQSDELQSAVNEIDELQSFRGPNNGRVFFWLLGETVTSLTGGRPPGLVSVEGVFPTVLEPGFEEWRTKFGALQGSIMLLTFYRAALTQDFVAFADILPQANNPLLIKKMGADAVDQFFRQTEAIGLKLDEIVKQETLKRPYVFAERVHLTPILTMSVLALVTGVVVPLLLLALSAEQSRGSLTAILLASLIFTGWAFIQFALDITTVAAAPTYGRSRWDTTLKLLDTNETRLSHVSLIELAPIREAAGPTDQIDEGLRSKLEAYVYAGDAYNEAARALTARTIDAMRSDAAIVPAIHNLQTEQPGSGKDDGASQISFHDANLLHPLLRLGDAAEAPMGFGLGLRSTHTLADISLDTLLQVKAQLLIEFALEPVLPEQIEEARQERHFMRASAHESRHPRVSPNPPLNA